jgi:hypothetical protein
MNYDSRADREPFSQGKGGVTWRHEDCEAGSFGEWVLGPWG